MASQGDQNNIQENTPTSISIDEEILIPSSDESSSENEPTANTHMKGKAAMWMQPYVEDFLPSPATRGTRDETNTLFRDWEDFKEEMGRISGELDAKNQAEKAVTRLRQTKSVSAYTAKFKQIQARIDWNDASLRTAFEAGLKEKVKDGLLYHDKPDTLHKLIELATRIDNRLWERAQQKGRFQPTTANMRKQRSRTDKDGDTIMAEKAQEKTKHNKLRGTNQDGIFKEERQKRFENKACLRFGETGHFRRDCPRNEVKQASVKADMAHFRTPEPEPIVNPEGDVGNITEYDEAHLLGREPYVEIPQPIQMEETVSWDEPQDANWVIYKTRALQKVAQRQCWLCGDTKHLANDCTRPRRIRTTSYNAQNTIHQAHNEQPYHEEKSAETSDHKLPQKSTCTCHKDLLWVGCKQRKCSSTPCANRTKQFSLSNYYSGKEYSRYKSHEKDALKDLFKGGNYKRWTVQEIYRAAEQAVPLLSKRDLSNVIERLQKSIMSRQKFSLRFRFASKRSQMGHVYWTDMIQRICKLARPKIATANRRGRFQDRKMKIK